MLRLGLVLGMLAFGAHQLRANVVITMPTGGNNVPADKALNSTNGAAFTALGNLVLTEGAASDFAAGADQTLVLTVPPGWQFKPGVGTASFTGSRNITAAAVSVTASTVTVTFSAGGIDKLDTLTIGGLQVQALDGANVPGADHIRCLYGNSGTAVIAGIEPDWSDFGLLNQVAGAAKALAMQTQPGATATVGALFAPQPQVKVVDQFGTLLNVDNSTVVTAARAAGSGALLGSLKCIDLFGVAGYTNLSINTAGTITIQFTATNLAGVISAPIVVGPAPADRLVFATQPGSASAGVPFGIQPVLKTQDRFGSDSTVGLPASKMVTVNLSSGTGTLSGTTTLDIGTAAGNGVAAFTNLQLDTAGANKQLTATASSLSNAVSAAFGVSAAVFSKLQVLLPGESAAPGTLAGKTGTPSPQAAGTPFNVTINAVDANWNVVDTISDLVGLTSSAGTATLPANAALVSGTKTLSVTLNTVGSATLTATDLTDISKSPNTSSAITVGGGTPRKLALQAQPSATATAGVPFAQQPVVRVEDAGGNLVATDNGRVITVARGLGSAALQGTLSATTVNGLATFSGLSYNLAETITLNFTATGLTNVTSGNVVVGTGSFTKLQLLVPGETAVPGTSTGKTGTPAAQIVGGVFPVVVNAVDAYWNPVNTVADLVGIASSDANAILQAGTVLVGGTRSFLVTLNTPGTATLTAADVTDGSKSPATSPAITVSPAQYTPATGGGAIAADGATGTFTSLSGPSYAENVTGDAGVGTIILNAPAGFVFDTGGTAPTVLVTRLSGSGKAVLNINRVASGTALPMTSVTASQLVFTVTSSSASGIKCSLTWQNVRVRPTAGKPLASGNLRMSGTASVVGLSTSANLGTLREVAGAASSLAIAMQPSAAATAGVPFAQQPVVQVWDQFANVRSAANGVADTTVVSTALGAGTGTLQGSLSVSASNGVATFINLSHNVATNITLAFSAPGVTGTNSSTIAVSPAAADRLVFVTQPGSSTYGSALSPQPVLKTQDSFGNDSTVGLAGSQIVSLTLSAGSGALQGTTALDIGTAAGNGMVSFSGLQVSAAGTGKQLSASISGGLSSALSSTFAVSPVTVTASITANNKIYDGTAIATIATRALNGVLGSDVVTLSGGTATFASKNTGLAKTVTATGLSLSGAAAGNYQLASTSATALADITARPLVVSATGVNRVYDGTASATVTISDDRVAGDVLSVSYTSASFASKNAGTAKTINVSGISVTGTDAANYTANTSATATADITARTLTVSATAANKVYDGTTDTTVTLADNRIAGDSLSTSYTGASFASKNVGTAKPVNVSGISVTGADAGNYTANASATATADITTKGLTVSGISAADKVYDGTTTATLNSQLSTLNGVLSGDYVTLNAAGATGAFADKNAGAGKAVNVSALSLSGADAGNYSLAQPTTTASITKAGLTVTADNKTRAAGQSNPTLTASYAGFVGGETLATSGVTGSPALSTTITDVAGTYPISADLGTLSAANYSFSVVNGVLTVTAAPASTLVILSQPSGAAVAGEPFAQQPVIGVQDAYGNLRSNDNSTVVTVARNNGSGTLQGTLSVTAINGVATFANLSHDVANTINLSFAGSSLAGATSASIVVRPAAFSKLQLLVPGETAAPGTITGKSGTPGAQVAGLTFDVTVNAVDNYWNLVDTATDTVALSSSDATATLPPSTALAGGTSRSTVLFDVNGSFTLTATDLTDGSKSPSTSPAITVSGAQFTAASGGGAIPADDAVSGVFTSLTGPIYSENNPGEVGIGTIILNAPVGFIFDTNGTLPTVSSVKLSGGGNNPVQGSVTSVTMNQITYTVTASSANPTKLTWQNIRVRPTAGTPLVGGNLRVSGTASVVGLSTSANLGALREVAGAASSLAMVMQPSATATAGVPFAQQPVLQVRDQFGNLCTNSCTVTAARDAGSGTLQGTVTATATNGVVTFSNLAHNVATNITLAFSAPGLTGTNSSAIAVSPTAADHLVFVTQPGSTTYGSALSPQPVLKTQDSFGNDSSVGLGASQMVSLTLSAGTGVLQGTTALDIGTAAGNGTVSFSGLQVSAAGPGKQLSASASGSLTSATSSSFGIAQATITGSITANSKVYDGTTAATIATRALNGVLGSDAVTLSGGSATFASKNAGLAKTVTATGLSLSGADAANYQLASTSATALADITARPLLVSATGVNRVYDGTTSATVTLSDNRVAADVLSATYTSAAFVDKNVGTAKPVAVSGISITGADAANYSANTSATATADITARSLTVSATGADKVYDGTTDTTVTLADNRIAGDSLSTSYTSASFTSKNAGTAKSINVSGISVTGADAGNYTANASATATANITPRSLSVSATGLNKVYDGTTSATVTLADDRLAGDSLSASYTGASFASKNVGSARTVSVSGISLSGIDAANYSPNTTASATADITARSLTVTATGNNKAYDGTANATVILADDRVLGDSLTTSYTSAGFADKNVGTAKPVNVSGIAVTGTDAGNYQLLGTTATATANITAATVTALVTASNKVYDGTTAATIATKSLNGVLGSDDVNLSGGTAVFGSQKVGTGKTVTISGLSLNGGDAGNYQLGSSTATTTANITSRPLTVSATGVNKVYNGTTTATVTFTDDRVAGDSLSASCTSATFPDKNVGTAKPVSVSGISISGTDAVNYTVNTTASTTADITVRSLTVSATGASKVYDGTTDVTVTLSDNRVSGDSLTTSYASASFASKNAGTAKPVSVTGITLSGTDASNYTANTTASATANITAKALTVSGITAADKVYDATTSATVNAAGATLAGVLSGDTVALNAASATGVFASKSAGTAKTVTVSGLSLSGADAGNYSLAQPTTTASITKAGLTVTADNKTRTAGQSNPTLTASYAGFVGGETLSSSGVTGSPALSTATTNVAGTYPITAALGTLGAVNYSFSFQNGVLTVTPASASTLAILTQPSSTAIAGVPFAQQPAVAIQDAYGNVRSSDNSTVVTAVRSGGSGTLQGTLTATAINGVATFANLSHNVANTISVRFSASGLTSATSANIVVGPGAFAKLQLLVPGETAAPGTVSGKTGTPSAQVAGTDVMVTVNAVDALWNQVGSVNDVVGITSSDATATLPLPTALVSGTMNPVMFFNINGSFTLTATDLTDGSKSASTSPAIAVSAAQFTPATGGDSIAADGAVSGAFSTLTGPTYSENNTGDVGIGTIILNAPSGFIFDTGGTPPSVLSVKLSGSGNSPVQGSITSVTANQITYKVTGTSGNPTKLTWQNVRVRPTAGTPLVSGNLRVSGTASVAGLSTGANLGTLREVAGEPANLVILTQPSTTAMAGVPFAQQPVLEVRDQFGQLRNAANGVTQGTIVTAASSAGSGALQGTTSMATVDGIVTFTNLSDTIATNFTILFTSGSATATSAPIVVSGGSASRLVFTTQPGGATAGSAFSAQPVLVTQDQFGNNTAAGLPANLSVSVSLSSGTGPLQGTTALDIGTGAGNGTVAFSDLRIDAAGTGKQLTASAGGLSNAVSGAFTVIPGPSANLVIQTQPPATATASVVFSPAPVIRLQDAYGNLVTTDNSTVVTATRNAGTAALLGTTSVTAANGLATFANLSYNQVETITIDFASSVGSATSSPITVGTGVASKLAVQTQPSSTATAGVAFVQQPVVYVTDKAGNPVSTNGLVITAVRGTGSSTLQGTLTATTVNGVATFTGLAYNVAETISLNFTSGSLTSATSSNVVVGAAAFAKLQLLAPGETAAPGSASGKTGTPTARTAGTAFNVTVNAVDAFWNLVTNATDIVNLSSTDGNALLPADAALVNGSGSLSVTLNTAGTQTLTASDISDGSKSASTSPAITINPGTFAKLQILVPGETAAPGTTAGKSGTSTAQTAGTGYTVTVNAVDANWNRVSTNDTVRLTSSDANATLPASAALSAGTRNFSVTNRVAGSWTLTASDVTHTTIAANTSAPISVSAGTFAKLQLLLPGETAAPGTTTGKTGTPSAQTAGTAFNVTVNAVDANWNVLSTVTDTVTLASSDANAILPANIALVAGTQSLSVTLRTSGTCTLTASDVTDGTKSASTSASIAVSAGAFVKLQLLVPGETAAPGTATGKTGTPAAQAVGTSFSATVRSVDDNWNLVSSTHTVGITSSDANAALPSNGALFAGTRNFSVTLSTLGSQTLTANDITDGTKSGNTSPSIMVNVGAANKLVLQTQPSSTATAGIPFAQQPVVYATDAAGNPVSTNGLVITASRGTGSGTLQGTLTATTVNGVATFANLSHNVATTITISFTASGLTSATSGSIVVNPAAASQLVFTTQPSGLRTGSPLATQPAVAAEDAFGNTSAIGLPANLNVTLALTSGSGSLLGGASADIGSAAGNGTATFTSVECSDAGTNKQITASAVGFSNAVSPVFSLDGVERATGGQAIPSSTAGGAWTALTGPVYYEYASGDAGVGTIILNAPSGFIFDTGGTAPTVRIDRLTGTGSSGKNINGVTSGTSVAIASRTATQVRVNVTSASSSGVTCSLTWENLRVRPAAASPLASGNLTKTGTSVMAAVTDSSTSFGQLIEYGPAARLVIQTQPSVTATAGVAFAQQPVIRIEDAAGHLLTADNTNIVTAARSAGSGTLQGTLTARATNGLATFANLAHNVATNITISFTCGLASTTSTAVAVSPAAADHLVFVTQPGSTTYGSALSPQPLLRTRDSFGNDSSVGLGASQIVSLTLSAGTGSLLGTASLDIGTAAGNGTVSFSGLQVSAAGPGKQLSASASGSLTSATSSSFGIAQATITGSITANSKVYDGTTAATIATRALNGVLGSDAVTLSGGSATFASKNAGLAKTVTATGLSLSGADAANYQLASTSATALADITARPLLVSATGVNRVYDGTTSATVTLSDNRVSGDVLSATYTSAAFVNKNVGTAKPVAVSGISITGADAANYTANTAATATADITARSLVVSATGADKVYDGTTDTTVTLADNRIAGDSLSTSYTGASFASKNAGTAKSINVSGISVTGADAGNYTANTSATATANITPRSLSVSATGLNKVYDGTTSATVTLADDRLAGDSLSASHTGASFASKNVGSARTVSVSGISLSGIDAANYSPNTTASATADITARSLTVTATGNNKVYDGTANATVILADDRVLGDSLTTSYTSAGFADKNVGTAKSVSVSGISVSGIDAGNYQLASTSATTTANITAATVTALVTADNKVYDGTTAATIATRTLSGVVGSDDVLLTGGTASFVDQNAGSGKTVTATGLSLSGASAGNYQLASASALTTADITPATLTVTAESKTRAYGAANPELTAGYSGFVSGENESVLSGSPSLSTSADTNSPVGGSPYTITVAGGTLSAANYEFGFVQGQLTITQAVLTVKADDQTMEFGAPVPPLTASYLGFANGEDTNVLSGSPDLSTSVTNDSPAGVYPITAAMGSLSASNYTFACQDGQLTVTSGTNQPGLTSGAGNVAVTTAQAARLTGIQVMPNGIKLTFSGSADHTYQVQRAAALQGARTVWAEIGSATTDAVGQAQFTDTNPTAGQGYYRAVAP